MNASMEKRYKNFIATVVDEEKIWVLGNEEEYATIEEDGFVNLIIYSQKENIDFFTDRYTSESVHIDDFLNECERKLGNSKFRFAVYLSDSNVLYISTSQIIADLEEELSRHGRDRRKILEENKKNRLRGVMNASAEKRYKNFITTVADYEQVWVLDNEEGYATIDQDGFVSLIVYPKEEDAEFFAKGDIPTPIDIDDFMDRCQESLEDPYFRFAVYPTDEDVLIVSTSQMIEDLEEELSLYD